MSNNGSFVNLSIKDSQKQIKFLITSNMPYISLPFYFFCFWIEPSEDAFIILYKHTQTRIQEGTSAELPHSKSVTHLQEFEIWVLT